MAVPTARVERGTGQPSIRPLSSGQPYPPPQFTSVPSLEVYGSPRGADSPPQQPGSTLPQSHTGARETAWDRRTSRRRESDAGDRRPADV